MLGLTVESDGFTEVLVCVWIEQYVECLNKKRGIDNALDKEFCLSYNK